MTEHKLSRREFLMTGGTFVCGLLLKPAMIFSSKNNIDEEVDKYILKIMEKKHFPGLSACIIKQNKITWSKGYGWANIKKKIPMSPDETIQNIGSISKTVTATAIMQLWEQGKFKLDGNVNDFLPFKIKNPLFPDHPITFRQLLSHRSSIKDGPAYGKSYACGDPKISLEEWLKEYFTSGGKYYNQEENFHTWEPGKKGVLPSKPRNYSNVGFGVLGYLVEVISGIPFNRYCSKFIFKPLGMDCTGWYLKEINTDKHAVPYSYIADDFSLPGDMTYDSFLPKYSEKETPITPQTFFPHCYYSFPNYPDGLVRTSVNQLARFLMAYMNDGSHNNSRILKKETLKKIFSPQYEGDERWGLCWHSKKLKNGQLLWGHGGGDPGISTHMFFRPGDKTGVIVFINRGANVNEVTKYLFKVAS
jgi:CubicO group peptidase (beta-lactamase class C family)